MVANFAMSVLNGIGGVKLAHIVTGTTYYSDRTNPGSTTVALGGTYKYIILEIYKAMDYYSGSTNIIDSTNGTQLFFAVGTDKCGVLVTTKDYNRNNLSSIQISGNNLQFNFERGSGTKMMYHYNIYCFN